MYPLESFQLNIPGENPMLTKVQNLLDKTEISQTFLTVSSCVSFAGFYPRINDNSCKRLANNESHSFTERKGRQYQEKNPWN